MYHTKGEMCICDRLLSVLLFVTFAISSFFFVLERSGVFFVFLKISYGWWGFVVVSFPPILQDAVRLRDFNSNYFWKKTQRWAEEVKGQGPWVLMTYICLLVKLAVPLGWKNQRLSWGWKLNCFAGGVHQTSVWSDKHGQLFHKWSLKHLQHISKHFTNQFNPIMAIQTEHDHCLPTDDFVLEEWIETSWIWQL